MTGSNRTLFGLLTLLSFRGIGSQTAKALARLYETPEALRDAAGRDDPLVNRRIRLAVASRAEWSTAMEKARRTVDRASRIGVRLVCTHDAEYPELLKEVTDGPAVLYVRGRLLPGSRGVACVGTRGPSAFGEEAARRIVRALAGRDWSIVSGLARGIDTICHCEALAARGHTIAVLGNGLDTVHPKENQSLAEAILARGGALVSEQPFGALPRPPGLIRATRIQSGIARGTVAVQTALGGGTIHTMAAAIRQKRLLFVAVPTAGEAADGRNSGNLAFARLSGPALGAHLAAHRLDKELRAFGVHPAAIPLCGRSDYAEMLAALEAGRRDLTRRNTSVDDLCTDSDMPF